MQKFEFGDPVKVMEIKQRRYYGCCNCVFSAWHNDTKKNICQQEKAREIKLGFPMSGFEECSYFEFRDDAA